jgi:hypothetical protein
MSLVTWNGKLLLSPNGKLTLGPAADVCCCVGPPVDGCCGRLQPGNESLEGPEYYPLTLHVRFTAGTCSVPAAPVEYDLTWSPTELVWMSEANVADPPSIPLGGTGGYAKFRISCIDSTAWAFGFEWGICTCNAFMGACTGNLTPTLNASGTCDPLILTGADLTLVGLMCCDNLGGGTITIEVWE